MSVPLKYRQMMNFWKYYSGEAVAPVPTLFSEPAGLAAAACAAVHPRCCCLLPRRQPAAPWEAQRHCPCLLLPMLTAALVRCRPCLLPCPTHHHHHPPPPPPHSPVGGNHEASSYLWELFYGGWAAPNIYFLGYSGAACCWRAAAVPLGCMHVERRALQEALLRLGRSASMALMRATAGAALHVHRAAAAALVCAPVRRMRARPLAPAPRRRSRKQRAPRPDALAHTHHALARTHAMQAPCALAATASPGCLACTCRPSSAGATTSGCRMTSAPSRVHTTCGSCTCTG